MVIKKIFNWVGGGFFRSLGRILLYIAIGIFAVAVFNSSDLKLPRAITRLIGIDYIKATTTDRWALNLPNVVDGRWYDCNGATSCNTQMSTATVSINSRSYIAGDDIGTIASNGMLLQYYSPSNFKTGYLYNVGLYMCSTKNLSDVDFEVYSNLSGSRGTNNNIYSSSARTTLSNEPFAIGSEVGDYCYLYQGQFVPATDTSWVQLRLKKSSGSITNFTPALISITVEGVGPYETIIKNAVRSAINQSGLATSTDITNMSDDITSAQQDTTNAVNDINDTLNDTNTTSDNSDMGDFINDFELSSDGRLSTLLTIPITFLQNVLSSSSNADLCADYKGQHICLPSGNLIWGRQDALSFRTFFDLFVGGYLAYKMLRSFIKTSTKALNPNDDKIEVMKL